MINTKKVIIDTDIGDDIDDALALALALTDPALELVGVTTVFRDVDMRARIAKKLLAAYGRTDIPVIVGCGDPLCGASERPPLCQFEPDLTLGAYEPDGKDAPAFIAECCRKYGKALTVIGLGPYTNLAHTVQRFPGALDLCDRVVVMGGTFFEHHREWNVLCDVEAADTLFSAAPGLSCVGFDVTKQMGLCYRQYRHILDRTEEGPTGYLGALTRKWGACNWRTPTLHDPLTVYYVAHPDILFMREISAAVELTGACTRGFTVNLDTCDEAYEHLQPARRIRVAAAVDSKRMIDDFMKTVFQYQ